jgi:hypothetical protein
MAEQPIDDTRPTQDGPIRLSVTPDGAGWIAAIRGRAVEAVRRFSTVAEANAWVRESFRAMFPESG